MVFTGLTGPTGLTGLTGLKCVTDNIETGQEHIQYKRWTIFKNCLFGT